MVIPPVPVLDVYYAPTCLPCRLELPVLAEAVRDGLSVTVMLLTEEAKARRQLAAVSPQLAAQAVAVPGGGAPRAVLRAAGDGDGILPYSVVRSRQGGACRSWRGALTLERIRRLLTGC